MPALLTENGFIDTVADANKLKTSSFIQSLARGHANGLEQAFNLKKTSKFQGYIRFKSAHLKSKRMPTRSQVKPKPKVLTRLSF